jgi:hypothetical protein
LCLGKLRVNLNRVLKQDCRFQRFALRGMLLPALQILELLLVRVFGAARKDQQPNRNCIANETSQSIALHTL